MSSDHTEIKFRIEGPGVELDTFGWPAMREFMDRLVQALAAMDGGPSPKEIVPTRVLAGSAMPVLRVPSAAVPAVYRFRAGPNRTWTNEQRRKAAKVYQFLEDRNATLSCGARVLKPVEMGRGRPDWQVKQALTLEGEVRRVGGVRGGVDVVFQQDGFLHCSAPRDLTKRLAPFLYERVALTGTGTRDPRTNELLQFRIERFRVVSRGSLAAGLERLHQRQGEALSELDPAARLKELRG